MGEFLCVVLGIKIFPDTLLQGFGNILDLLSCNGICLKERELIQN